MNFDNELATNPNKYAPQSSYALNEQTISLGGYQNFKINLKNKAIENLTTTENILAKKSKIVSQAIYGYVDNETSVLDIGGNNGFYSLMALLAGAKWPM